MKVISRIALVVVPIVLATACRLFGHVEFVPVPVQVKLYPKPSPDHPWMGYVTVNARQDLHDTVYANIKVTWSSGLTCSLNTNPPPRAYTWENQALPFTSSDFYVDFGPTAFDELLTATATSAENGPHVMAGPDSVHLVP